MAYTVNKVKTNNYNDRPGNKEPIGICIHHWGVLGQKHDDVARYLASHRPANPTSAHDVISAGRVTELVPWNKRAWHGRSANDLWIGLECRPEMSAGDWQTLVERCADIERHYGKSMKYARHSDFVNTACPGKYRTMIDQLIKDVNKELGKTSSASPKPSKPATAKPKPKPAMSKSISTMAKEVIAGKHGNGHATRQRSLGVSNAVYEKVRAEVNRKSAGAGGKSIATMASEVIAGKHGSGHAARQRSLGVSNNTYAKVRAEVNRRLS